MKRLYVVLMMGLMGWLSVVHADITFVLKKGAEVRLPQEVYEELSKVVAAGKVTIINGKVTLPTVKEESFEDLIINLTAIHAGGKPLERFIKDYYEGAATREKYSALITAAHLLGITKILEAALVFAARKGDHVRVKELLGRGAQLTIQDSLGMTPLMHAVDDLETLKLLMSKGVPVDTQNTQGLTALMIASSQGCAKAVKLLLEKTTQVDQKDSHGKTALFWAATHDNNREILTLLIGAGANVDLQDDRGRSALMEAVMSRNKENLKVLLAAKPSIDWQDSKGKTALMYATLADEKEQVELLLAAKASVDIRDNQGRTAVDMASFDNDIKDLLNKAPSAPPLKRDSDAKMSGITLERGLLVVWLCYFGYLIVQHYASQNRSGEAKGDLAALDKTKNLAHTVG